MSGTVGAENILKKLKDSDYGVISQGLFVFLKEIDNSDFNFKQYEKEFINQLIFVVHFTQLIKTRVFEWFFYLF
jgi:hypothetical protein